MSDRYCVFGNPVGHSKSPLIHAAFAAQCGQDLSYEALLVPLDGFAASVRAFVAADGHGANVTVPFKEEAFHLADRLTVRAELAAAVNTLRFDGAEILGDNTDGAGLIRDITANLNFPVYGKRVLLMGAGGASRGVILPLLQQQPALLAVANRTPRKALDLQQQFATHGQISAGGYLDFAGEQFDIIINATAASLNDDLPELPGDIFAAKALAYDMMYSTKPTRFLQYAAQRGAPHLADGIGMLVEQAAESFYLWRGIRPDTRAVIAQLRNSRN